MYKKILFVLLLLCSTSLWASLFGDDEKKEIYLPIAQEVYAMIEEGKDPLQSVKDLLLS